MRSKKAVVAIAVVTFVVAGIGIATANGPPPQQSPGAPQGAGTATPAIQAPTLAKVGLGCADAIFAREDICNTAGQCVTTNYSCFPYTCDPTTRTCARSCASNAACSGGFACWRGQCVVPVPHCVGDISQSPFGTSKDCAPYHCGTNGMCLTQCVSVNDCVPPQVCDPTGHCAPRPQ